MHTFWDIYVTVIVIASSTPESLQKFYTNGRLWNRYVKKTEEREKKENDNEWVSRRVLRQYKISLRLHVEKGSVTLHETRFVYFLLIIWKRRKKEMVKNTPPRIKFNCSVARVKRANKFLDNFRARFSWIIEEIATVQSSFVKNQVAEIMKFQIRRKVYQTRLCWNMYSGERKK